MSGLVGSAKSYRNELIAVALIVAASFLMPVSTPGVIRVQGVASGTLLALHAIPVVLIYRTHRFVNFAQLEFASLSATLLVGFVNGQPLLRMASGMCPPCFADDGTFGPIALGVNLVLAIAITIVLTLAFTAAVNQSLVRRFQKAPRLMPTLVSIFLAQAIVNVHGTVFAWLTPAPPDPELVPEAVPVAPVIELPERLAQPFGAGTLSGGDVIGLVTALVAAVAVGIYLKRSAAGAAIRAAGENPERAGTLGMDVVGVQTRVWLLVGGFAAIAGLAYAITSGAPGLQGAGAEDAARSVAILPVAQLIGILAVGVVARFQSLPLALVTAVAYAHLLSVVRFSFGSTAPLDAVLVLFVGVLLLLQREERSRASRETLAGVAAIAREARPIPRELRHFPAVQRNLRTARVLLGSGLLAAPWLLDAGQTNLLAGFFAYAVVGLSLLVLTGWAGQISLGQWGFATMGAWVLAVTGWPLPLAVLFAAVVGAVAAVVVGFPALKLKGLQLAVATLALSWSASVALIDDRYLGQHLPDRVTNRTLFGLDLGDARTGYYVLLVLLVAFVMAVLGLRRSRFGRALIAARSNEEGANSFGIDPRFLRLTAFAVSGALAAMGGALFAAQQGIVAPESFTADESLRVFSFTVIGGLGGVAGPLLGTTFLAVLSLGAGNQFLQYISAGVGGLLLLLTAPGGLSEVAVRARDAGLRRLAIRHRIPVATLLGDRSAKRLQGAAALQERVAGAKPVLPPLRYEPNGQWALARYGDDAATRERVGVTSDGGRPR